MSILFRPGKINQCWIPNRIVRSATYDAAADEQGNPTERQFALFEALAKGGIGLIVTGLTSVAVNGQVRPYQIRMDNRTHMAGLKELTERVHAQEAKIAVQFAHGGRVSSQFHTDGGIALAPSLLEKDTQFGGKYRAFLEEEIADVIEAFRRSAEIAKEAGFDGIQVHGAHGFLLSQFLSPKTNFRRDSWGGSLLNRTRIHCEIYRSIRSAVGSDFPVMIKLGVRDGFRGGLGMAEGTEAVRMLAEIGYDAIEVSIGLRGKEFEETEFRTDVSSVGQEAYFRDLSRTVKRVVKVPVIAVGGFRSRQIMEETLEANDADFISMCRPFIREPELVRHWQKEEGGKATCISCNQCLEGVKKNTHLRCYQP